MQRGVFPTHLKRDQVIHGFRILFSLQSTMRIGGTWFFQGRLTRFEVHGGITENFAKTACFSILREVKV